MGEKNNVVAGLLGIFLGIFGVHEFYVGRNKRGLLYLLFCWTGIPAIVGLIQGILFLVADEDEFAEKFDDSGGE